MASAAKLEQNRKKILEIFLQNPTLSYASIGRLSGTSRATSRNVIIRFQKNQSNDRKPGSGRPAGFLDSKLAQKIKRNMISKPNASLRDLTKKYHVSHSYVQKVKKRFKLRSYAVIKVPNRNDTQNTKAKGRARKLLRTVLTNFKGCIIMDDETYVKADFKQLPGKQYYTAYVKGGVKKIFKFKKVDKYAKKYLVWQGICSCGYMTKPFVTKGILNQELYIKECLQKRLLPMYKQHNIPPIFWPDLATIHYSNKTVDWYKSKSIYFVPKTCNPPNCPELRPIEKFWAIIKQMLRKTSKTANDRKKLYVTWNNAAKKVGRVGVQKLMAGLKAKIRFIQK